MEIVMAVWSYIRDLLMLPILIRRIMATLEEVLAQQAATSGAVSNIAADVQRLKDQIDSILAGEQGRIDAAVAEALQQVSDGMAPIVASAEALAAATPDPEPPVEPEPVA